MPAIKTELLDTRKARYALREVYANKRDLWAGLLAHEVSRGRTDPAAYYAFADRLMLTQDDWAFNTPSDDEALAKLKKLAADSGLSLEDADRALYDERLVTRIVSDFAAAVKEHNIAGTPTILVNGEATGTSLEDIRAAVSQI